MTPSIGSFVTVLLAPLLTVAACTQSPKTANPAQTATTSLPIEPPIPPRTTQPTFEPYRPDDSLYDLALPENQSERDALNSRIQQAINAPDRPLEHRIRDDRREVRSILAAARPNIGASVLDMGSGSGYLAHLFSSLVGEAGHVDAHNTPGWIAQFPAMDPEHLSSQLKRDNIAFITTRWDNLPKNSGPYDVIVMGQVYHDAVLEGADVRSMNRSLFKMLKPGGRLIIEDHVADPTMTIGKQVGLHRIALSDVRGGVLPAGFIETKALAIISIHDDPNFNVFRPGIRGRTERFILVFEKPGN